MSSSRASLEKYRIPLEEICRATNDFCKKNRIGDGGFGIVYVGKLSERWNKSTAAFKRLNRDGYQGNNEFFNELEMVSSFHHPNIIPFIGYCDENNEMLIVYEYATNGSLDQLLQDPVNRHRLTWAQRLNICIGAAKGLEYLHSGLGEYSRVIHRDVKSANILLDHKLEAKICDFGLSRFGPRNRPDTQLITKVYGTRFYMDPIYNERGKVSKRSDVYSFGVVLFEMSSGMMAYHQRCVGDGKPQYLIDLVRSYYEDNKLEGGLDTLIDPIIKGQIDMHSFETFNKIAHECISLKVKERPTMDRIITRIEEALKIQSPYYQETLSSSEVNLENYLIPLKEIRLATENFSPERCIGGGGFGLVYRGLLSSAERWQNLTVAIKRLGHDGFQGEQEFRNELLMLFGFHHKNIISLIGYCDEGNEMILVYEYAMFGSLDDHLHDPNKMRHITWTQRLMICIGAARGLNYLHSGLGEHTRVIHRDVKSANILLDGNFVAKISDFGLSKVRRRNQPETLLYTKLPGTRFYIDPTYHESGILEKESNVYSFGIVMFEMLSGMLVYTTRSIEDDRPQFLMNLVRRYHHNIAEKLIDPDIRDQISSRSVSTFQEIAYQCISFNLMERPTMDKVIERIGEALDIQMEENVAVLCECVEEETGFSDRKAIAAFTIYKCLLHWKCLEAERTSVFDQLIHIIISAIEDGDNNNQMAYWLSNATTLLFLIQESLRKPPPRSWRYERVAMESLSSVSSGDPALLFKKRLIAYVEKIYDIIRDNMKKELGSLLALCIQATPRSEGVPISGRSFNKDSHLNHWQGIVDCLNTHLKTLKENFVPQKIVQKIFSQIFSYINVKIFNSLLLRRECCSFKNGEYVKSGLAELELWCCRAKEESAGSAWDALQHVRQASGLLTLLRKDQISYQEISNDLCPILSLQQMHRICTLYWDDNENTPRVSSDVISIMRILMTENASINSFLMEDSSSMPFSVDDLSTSMQLEDFVNVKPSAGLSKYPAFQFLYN